MQQITAGPSQSVANFSYGFDTIGNLTSRADTYQGYTEAFCYDDLNRLTDSAMVSGGTTCATGTNHKVVTYNAIGNIVSKTGIGTYAYPASGASSVQPHAVSDVPGTVNGHSHPYYRYDPNGNLTCMSSSSSAAYGSCTSAIRTVTYTAFNMAAQIVEGSSTYAFSYDSEHARIKQVAPGLTTLYLNAMGAMSEKLVGASSTTWRDYILADGRMVAQRDKVVSSGTVTWSYFVADHLGSIAVITDASGAVTERLSYDAWGKRRNANGTDANCGTISSSATRGFTGHEMLDGLCLVNMNARIYDPDIGRFMTWDIYVADGSNLQDWNPYTYVNNNPLSFTDPTGHFKLKDILGAVITIALFAIAPEIAPFFSTVPGLIVTGIVAGGLAAIANHGNVLVGALLGGLQMGLGAGLGSIFNGALGAIGRFDIGSFIAQGLTGGVVSAIQGGNFGAGFLSAGVASLAGPLTGEAPGTKIIGTLYIIAYVIAAAVQMLHPPYSRGHLQRGYRDASKSSAPPHESASQRHPSAGWHPSATELHGLQRGCWYGCWYRSNESQNGQLFPIG